MSAPTAVSEETVLHDAALRAWPLPAADDDGDKAARGQVLVVGGSAQVPGALLLAGEAALRAGAGKVMLATTERIATAVAVAFPEARVIALPEDEAGLHPDGVDRLAAVAHKVDALLVGPGMLDQSRDGRFIEALLPVFRGCAVVLDALAMHAAAGATFDTPPLLTPHAGEMAKLTGRARRVIEADPGGHALEAARRWNAVVALKGPATRIATPDGQLWRSEAGNVGLATSGSGDVLAGLVAGLAARGAPLAQAAAWGVALHGRAGDRLAQRFGGIGYLARELAAEVPSLLAELSSPPAATASSRPSMRAT